jgi:hypothetical protein
MTTKFQTLSFTNLFVVYNVLPACFKNKTTKDQVCGIFGLTETFLSIECKFKKDMNKFLIQIETSILDFSNLACQNPQHALIIQLYMIICFSK